MNKIDKLGMMVAAIGECCLCDNESADIYTVRFVDNHGNKFIMEWRVCQTCRAEIMDIFSEWIAMFCVDCKKAGWLKRDGNVPEHAHAGFAHGCYHCSTEVKGGWWLSNELLLN